MNKMHIDFDIMGLLSPTKNIWLRMLLVSVGWNTNDSMLAKISKLFA